MTDNSRSRFKNVKHGQEPGDVSRSEKIRIREHMTRPRAFEKLSHYFDTKRAKSFIRNILKPKERATLKRRAISEAEDMLATLDMIENPRAVCILLTQGTGDDLRVLAVSRRDDPNAFGLPGGKVDAGEEPLDAAVRELREETGLDVTLSKRDLNEVLEIVCRGEIDYQSTAYALDYDPAMGTPATQPDEGVVAWVRPGVLLQGPFRDYNRVLFERVGIPL